MCQEQIGLGLGFLGNAWFSICEEAILGRKIELETGISMLFKKDQCDHWLSQNRYFGWDKMERSAEISEAKWVEEGPWKPHWESYMNIKYTIRLETSALCLPLHAQCPVHCSQYAIFVSEMAKALGYIYIHSHTRVCIYMCVYKCVCICVCLLTVYKRNSRDITQKLINIVTSVGKKVTR